MLTQQHTEILAARGLSEEKVLELGWRSVERPRDGDTRCWVEIPYMRDGVEVGKKVRTFTGKKEFYQEKGSEQCLYNLDALIGLDDDTPIVITEGEPDCVIALQCGHLAVSVPNGAPDKPIENEESKKFNFLDDLPEKNPIILAVDSDGPGVVLLNELAKRLGRDRCKWIRYPQGCKDLNQTFENYGEEGVRASFERQEWLQLDGLYSMNDIPPSPEFEAFDCGIDGMADFYRLRQGDVSVITGIPSHGKTTFANEVACNMAKLHGWHICIGSFEQSPKPDHQRYLRTYHMRKAAHLVPVDSDQMRAADEWINTFFKFVIPDIESEDFVTVDWLLARCAMAVKRYGCKLIVIDPWNELDHHRPNGMNLTEYTGWAIKEIKRFARRYQVHVIIVAHPSKMEKNQSGGYSMPTLYDISDSSHWYNKPDIGIVIYRTDTMLNIAKVAKVRYVGVIGQPGQVTLRYDTYLGQFMSLNAEEVDVHVANWKANNSKPLDGSDKPLKGWGGKRARKKHSAEGDDA